MVPEKNVHQTVCDILMTFNQHLGTIKRVCSSNPKFINFLEEECAKLARSVNNLEKLEAKLRDQPKEPHKTNFNKMP